MRNHGSSSDDELEGVFSPRVIGEIAREMTRWFFGFVRKLRGPIVQVPKLDGQ